MFDYHGLKISWLGHDSFRIKNGKTIIIDPFKLRSTPDKADILRIYHAGDTDAVPEMKGLKPDVALLPVSGTYVMNAEEAAQAARMVEPKLAIPMHYGAIVGSEQDAHRFKQLATCEVQILQQE